MKTTLALALTLFVIYLAGCDFAGSNEANPADLAPAPLGDVNQMSPEAVPGEADEPIHIHFTTGDTTGYEGAAPNN